MSKKSGELPRREVLLSTREQVLRAKKLGHELSVAPKTVAEPSDALVAFCVRCRCGWDGGVVRSRRSASSAMVWHLRKALAEAG